jgi:tRNA dimethylallyltransferase
MTPEAFGRALVLSGPTASGKSQLALEVAEALGAEVVAMDSMTLYRGMDVGTAKPTPEERRRVPHHLVDVLEPWQPASVAWWLEQATDCCKEIEARGKTALFVGGTGLYLKALLFGLFDGPPADEALRARLAEEAERTGPEALHARLAAIDPTSAQRLSPNDVRRAIRALEVWELTGQPLSAWQTQWGKELAPSAPRCVWLERPREELYRRINARVEAMVAGGLIEEARALRALPRPLGREASQAVGYREAFEHLDGRLALADVVRAIQTRTRQLAKRQLTWFRHLPGCVPVCAELTSALRGLRMGEEGRKGP